HDDSPQRRLQAGEAAVDCTTPPRRTVDGAEQLAVGVLKHEPTDDFFRTFGEINDAPAFFAFGLARRNLDAAAGQIDVAGFNPNGLLRPGTSFPTEFE